MTNPLQTIPNLPAVTSLSGSEEIWVNQAGVDRRATVAQVGITPGPQGNPGGNASAIGVATIVSSLSLNSGVSATYNLFHTDGYYTAGDGGGAFYYRNTGSAQPADLISADGVRLSLSLAQQLTWEMLGAPATGAICTATISGTTMTTSAVQSGAIAIGQTVTAIGATGAVSAGTIVTGGSGTSWTVNHSQSVGSTVVCLNDSQPYVSAALQLGKYGLLSIGPKWFSQATVTVGFPYAWFGPQGYLVGDTGYPSTFYYPAGYAGIVAIPSNFSANAQGDVTQTGTQPFGGVVGSSLFKIAIQIGNGNLPASTANNRPAIALYTKLIVGSFQTSGADGDGLYIFGNAPACNSNKCAVRDGYISNSYGNGIETNGGDANTCDFSNIIIDNCGASGVDEHGFLGNGYRVIQVQTTGAINAVVRRTNNLYYSIQDANTNNDPAVSSGWWQLIGSSSGADTWNSGTTYHVGASYRTTGGANFSKFDTCYSESSALPALFQAASGGAWLTIVDGGLFGSGIDSTNGGINGIAGATTISNTFQSYTDTGYAYDTTGGASGAIGYRANNIDFSPTTSTCGVFDAALHGIPMARFGGKLAPPGTSTIAYISSYQETTNNEIQMQWWNGNTSTTGPFTDDAINDGSAANRWLNNFTVAYRPGSGAPLWTSGAGSPNTVLAAPVGSLYTDTAGGSGTTLYVKESGSGNTGWVAK